MVLLWHIGIEQNMVYRPRSIFAIRGSTLVKKIGFIANAGQQCPDLLDKVLIVINYQYVTH